MYDVTPSTARPDKKYAFHTLFRASNRTFQGSFGTGKSLIVVLVATAISVGCRHPFSWCAQALRTLKKRKLLHPLNQFWFPKD